MSNQKVPALKDFPPDVQEAVYKILAKAYLKRQKRLKEQQEKQSEETTKQFFAEMVNRTSTES